MLNLKLTEAHIKLISKKAVNRKFDYATIGGFAVKDEHDQETAFDWSRYDGNHTKTNNGHIGIEWTLSDFDTDHFESNENGSETPDWEKIVQSALTEVQYDNGYYNDETREETFVPMILTQFNIIAYNDDYSVAQTYEFSTAQIADFNKRENAVTA